jgi:SecD/SecF fusion protein
VRGFQAGIDFKGGRTYVVRFDRDVKVADVQSALAVVFNHTPEVKTFGNANTVRITTTYKIDDLSENSDNLVEEEMYAGLKKSGFIGDVSLETFDKVNLQSSQKVGPTISDDLKKDAVIAVLLSLVMIFVYVAIRFKNWQYGLGGLLSLAHDALVTLGVFSIFYSISPFSMEVDQGFIAAILTVIGYSINDTVVVYDRIREYVHIYPKRTLADNMDHAMNTTLRRTFSTNLTVIIVLLTIFLFGGASMQGFTFALLIGCLVGSYSTLFIAAPMVYDTILKAKKVQKI